MSNQEITATYIADRFRFENPDGDVLIGIASKVNGSGPCPDGLAQFTVKGPADLVELRPLQTYRFWGRWTEYTNRRTQETEQQFHFSTVAQAEPHGQMGVIAYLRQAGEGRAIGAARARQLWEIFGSDAVRMLRESPEECAAKIRGLSVDSAKAASAWLQQQQAREDCTIALTDLLAGRGFPRNTATRVIANFGNAGADLIQRDPYLLMNFRGCGFKRCDALWMHLGLPPAKLRRQALSIWYTCASDNEGHAWFPVDYGLVGLRQQIGGVDLQPEKALRLAVRINRLAPERHGAVGILTTDADGAVTSIGDPKQPGRRWIADGSKAAAEQTLAEMLSLAMRESHQWPDVAAIDDVSDHQREQLGNALCGIVAILGGRPGTGKTYTTARLVKLLIEQFGSSSIAIGAPTGKAAVRITELMQAYDVPLRARTWHSLLGVQSHSDGAGWSFEHGRHNPWPYRVIIGDETSMNDTSLMRSIFAARPVGCHVLLVGDVNQLPPVGHGAPLRDMIAAGIPYGELREIKRNSGGIVETCAAICDGERWEPGDNLVHHQVHDEAAQVRYLLEELEQAKAAGKDPVWDCQVVVAVNEKSKLSRKELNKVLQFELNKRPGVQGQTFREGDKIVNLKNGFFTLTEAPTNVPDEELQQNDKGEVFVANGELACVLSVEPKLLIAKLTSPERIIKIPRGQEKESASDESTGENGEEKSSTGCSWDLGYAISCHKSQGSEWPVVIIMIDDYAGARFVCDRSWVYTAISRAKERCVLIGKRQTLDRFCRETKIWKRKTFLRELIVRESAQKTLVEL